MKIQIVNDEEHQFAKFIIAPEDEAELEALIYGTMQQRDVEALAASIEDALEREYRNANHA